MCENAHYLLTIAYDGTAFHGWQRQEPLRENVLSSSSGDLPRVVGESGDDPGRVSLRTVQHVVQEAVNRVLGQPVTIRGASRTDAGVHARAQAAAFVRERLDLGPDDDRLVMAINSRLPDDVIVRSARRVRADFDPIGDCVGKGYRYRLHTGRERPLWDRWFTHHVRETLDVDAMREAARVFVGEHDFAAFAKAGHGRETTVRRVFGCEIASSGDAGVAIDVSGSGFLHNMVRIIAGTLVEVGRGRLGAEDIEAALTTGDRRRAGPTLPPTGLCLEWIDYAEKW
ncbi:MAG: tRNA pseudouridine(38-40) synthase TruA [Phycisphaeraceae bacterium]|nr:tRNA pseudouridine(38-40) synthase TruA [Phycisphaeraceae bacterium]